MTKEKAIYNLKALLTMGDFLDAYGDSICAEPYYEAVDMAIESLKNSERTEKSSQNVSNDDLISRKVAIDAICTEGTRLERNGTVAMAEIKQWCVDILDALPSAQPETDQIRWERDTAIQQLADLGYGLGEKPRTDGDTISRQAVIDELHTLFKDGFEEDKWWNSTHVLAAIKGLPSVKPEQKKGKWKRTYLDHEAMGERPSIFYCSECAQCVAYPLDYCPNCGARMER